MENRIVTINETRLPVKEYQGQRVVTMKEIDAVHQRPEGTARKRFNDNKGHFIEGVDYVTLNQPSEIRTLGLGRPQGGTPESVTLITESGYLMLVKSFTDDLAWAVQRQLVNVYFKATPEQRREAVKGTVRKPALSSVNGAVKLIIGAMEEAGVAPEYRVLALKGIYEPYGLSVPTDGLQVVERIYDLTGIADVLGVMSSRSGKPHAHAVGAILDIVGVSEHETKIVPYINNGHSGTATQYTPSVLNRVHHWLEVNKWPSVIEGVDRTKYKATYKEEG